MKIIIMSEEERYNNRQIERMLDEQSKELKEHISLLISPLTKQVMLTNGTVKWQTKLLYIGIGALVLLTPWASWVTVSLLSQDKNLITQEDLDTAVNNAVQRNLEVNP